MVAPHLDRCLDDESAAWFVGGKGTDTDRERVDAHLDACAPCRRRIAALALVSPPVTSFIAAGEAMDNLRTEPMPPPVRSRDGGTIPALGERIGRYVVLRTLGRGGMGVVVAAHDPELDRQVAIKLVHPTLWRTASREARELLRSEARAMARLVHPNVVTVHDLGTIDDQLF